VVRIWILIWSLEAEGSSIGLGTEKNSVVIEALGGFVRDKAKNKNKGKHKHKCEKRKE
jgi:hypothetical protein